MTGCVNMNTTSDVDERGETEREREAPHPADGEQVEHDRREEVHRVGRQDRAAGTLPAALDGGAAASGPRAARHGCARSTR